MIHYIKQNKVEIIVGLVTLGTFFGAMMVLMVVLYEAFR